MKSIKRTSAASGIIGQFDTNWEIVRLYDRTYDCESFNLYIAGLYVEAFPSVVEALKELVNQFSE